MTKVLRTPDDYFESLVNYNYSTNYFTDLEGYEGLRVHYLDEGDSSKEVFLCLHGQPTWGYLYRKMISTFVDEGFRVIVPDLIGFGRSDKPIDDRVYTFDFHRSMLISFIKKLSLERITLVCQDWGGVLGLTLPMEFPSIIKKLLLMNTDLATGDYPLSEGFKAWRSWAAKNPNMDIARLMQRSCPHITGLEAKAYAAPFPDVNYKAGVRRFPELFPEFSDSPGAEISRAARDFFSTNWQGDTFMAIGMTDPVLGPDVMHKLRNIIPGCSQPLKIKEAGHFVQEWGGNISLEAVQYFFKKSIRQ